MPEAANAYAFRGAAAWSEDGLPIGVDVMGRPWSETDLLSLGFPIERALDLRLIYEETTGRLSHSRCSR